MLRPPASTVAQEVEELERDFGRASAAAQTASSSPEPRARGSCWAAAACYGSARSSARLTLPLAVLGSSAAKSTMRGYL